MNPAFHKLNNPVWHSLAETHQKFSVDYKDVKFYHPDYCAFGSFENSTDTSKYLAEYSKMQMIFI